MKTPRRLGLFGGSFNPVHTGHLLLARWARQRLKLDEVWLIPQAASADGKRLAPAARRWQELRRALRGEAGLKACDVDLRLGGVSRTIETLRQLRRELGPGPRFTWLLGQDQALRLPRWREAEHLNEFCDFYFFTRAEKVNVSKAIHTRFRLTAIYVPSIDISSSWIRQQKQVGKMVDLAIPA